MKRGDILELNIESLAFGGRGIGRMDGYVIFVPGAVPGDRVRIRLKKKKSSYGEGQLLEIVQPAPERIDAPCRHFGTCGGCKWQNLPYALQLTYKKQHVAELINRVGGMCDVPVHDPIPCEQQYRYRNKMEFSFSGKGWLTPEELQNPDMVKSFALGFHLPGRHDRILNIDECLLMSEQLNQVLEFSRDWFRESGIPVYDDRKKAGQLRFLVLRESVSDESVMVNLVSHADLSDQLAPYVDEMTGRFPFVQSVFNTVNDRIAQVATGDKRILLHGTPVIRETIGGYVFEISPDAFFQTNSRQARVLYDVVKSYVGQVQGTLWDLYCGTGTIGIYLSGQVGFVRGFEIVDNAVSDAHRNAEANGVANCSFVVGDLRNRIRDYLADRPEIIVCDPPRAGMHPSVVQAIREAAPPTVVYVSCDPATMSRDLAALSADYRVDEVQPVDMFPHTFHIESVARLTRTAGR